MIKNESGDLYIGITENLNNRLNYHNSNKGAEFTKRKSKFKIVFSEQYETLTQARKREIQLKKWSRIKKEFLIEKFSKGLVTKI